MWEPDLCYHSKNCVSSFPKVFDPNRKPWIVAENASEQELRDAIDKCPSGALSYRFKGEVKNIESMSISIEPLKKGPEIIKGKLRIKSADGEQELEKEMIASCRCGASSKKPYCDGSHSKFEFEAD